MSSWLQDLRFGARVLVKNPGITAVIVLVLALGIGANTTIFSVVNAFLLRPLPYEDPGRLVHLFTVDSQTDYDQVRLSLPQYLDWKQETDALSGLAVYDYGTRNLTGPGADPEQLIVARLSVDMLPLLGVEPRRGRGFVRGEDEPGADAVVLLSDGVWRRRYGGREDILGDTIVLDGVPHTVVGIMAPHFHFPYPEAKLWIPLPTDLEQYSRDIRQFLVVGRLAAGVSHDQAVAQLETIHQRLSQEYPDADGRYQDVNALPLRQALLFAFEEIRILMFLLSAAVGFVLLIVAANVANILLARAGARTAEVAIRTSLGAGRRRLVRQFLTESALLSLLGGTLGIALAYQGVRQIESGMPEALYRVGALEVDDAALAFTLGVSLASAFLFGMVPALRGTRVDLSLSLKDGGRSISGGQGGRRLQNLLVVSQISLAVILLGGAFSVIRSAAAMRDVDLGFNPENVLTMRLSLPSAKYDTGPQRAAFFDDLGRRLESLPGVEAAAAILPLPMSFSVYGIEFEIPGRELTSPDERLRANRIYATPHYFSALGIPLLRGRAFSDPDSAEAPPAIVVNQSFVDRYFPDGDVVGGTVRLRLSQDDIREATMIGVVADVRDSPQWQGGTVAPQIYLAWAQWPRSGGHVIVRTSGDPKALLAPVRDELRRADPDLPVSEEWTMHEVLDYSVAPLQVASSLLGGFSVVAMLLAAVGIYGVVAYTTSRRRHEFGIRLALGADRGAIVRLVLRQGGLLTVIGVAIGLVISYALDQVLASQIPGLGGSGLLSLLAVAAVLAAAALVASFLPARRASRLDPLTALRYE